MFWWAATSAQILGRTSPAPLFPPGSNHSRKFRKDTITHWYPIRSPPVLRTGYFWDTGKAVGINSVQHFMNIQFFFWATKLRIYKTYNCLWYQWVQVYSVPLHSVAWDCFVLDFNSNWPRICIFIPKKYLRKYPEKSQIEALRFFSRGIYPKIPKEIDFCTLFLIFLKLF